MIWILGSVLLFVVGFLAVLWIRKGDICFEGYFTYAATAFFVTLIVALSECHLESKPDPFNPAYICAQKGGRIETRYTKVSGYDPHYYDTCIYGDSKEANNDHN